jgi:hypothetical protein
MTERALQPGSGCRDGASAELSAEKIKEMTSFESKEETEEIAKLIDEAFGKEMRQTYIAFEGNVHFFCTAIAAIMQPLFKQYDQTEFVLNVCQTATCEEQCFHFAVHLYDALEMCKHCVDRVNLNSSVACMASTRNYATVLAPAQDMAQVQGTIQKCQLILDRNGAFVARVKGEVERSRQSAQLMIALLKQEEGWPTFGCCQGSGGADIDSSINSNDSSSSGDESVCEETSSEEYAWLRLKYRIISQEPNW